MRVGIDITYAGKREGTGTYIRNLLGELARHPEIEWITFARPRPALPRRLPRPLARGLNGLLSILWLQLALPFQARKERLDLFHAPAFIAPLLLPCPLVLTVLDAYQFTLREQRDRLWSLYVRAFGTLATRRAARVLTISHHAATDVRRFFGVPDAKLGVTPLGVAPQFRRLPPAAAAARARPYALDGPFILFVGAGDARKNYRTLLAALRLLHERGAVPPPLVVTGRPTAEFARLAAEAGAATGGGVGVRFLGYVPDEALIALYNRAAVFAYPSRYEGFGLPILEAMACGCPVVCANASSLPEVAGDAALLVDPADPAALAAALATVLTDPRCAARLRARGLERAAAFQWSSTANATLALYREVCYTGGRSAQPVPQLAVTAAGARDRPDGSA